MSEAVPHPVEPVVSSSGSILGSPFPADTATLQPISPCRRFGPPVDPWGSCSTTLPVAGGRLLLEGLSCRQASLLHARYQDLFSGAVGSSPSLGRTRFFRQSVAPAPPERFAVEGIYTPQLRFSPGRLDVDGYGFAASMHLASPSLSGVMSDDEELTTEPLIFENYLRIHTAFSALDRGGLLLHCAAIGVDGGVYLFLGRSGAGKSTIARSALAAGLEVLSDDAALVLPGSSDDAYQAVHIPFFGELRQPTSPPPGELRVRRLFWLRKGACLELTPLTAASQVAKLMVCCPFANADPFRLARLFHRTSSLLRRHPMHELSLPKAESFTNVLRLLKRGGRV